MSRSFGRFVPMLALCLLASLTCGKDTSAPPLPDEPGPPTHIEGVLSYYEVVGNAQHNVSCTNQGTITIARDSADLTGTVHQTGTCIINGAYADNSGSAPVTGNVGAATVRFEFADCMYHGDLFNTPRDSAAGTSSFTVGGLVLAYGVIAGFGVGCTYVTPIATCIKWFPDKRGMIVGMAVMGFGVGPLVFGPLLETLLGTDKAMFAATIPRTF